MAERIRTRAEYVVIADHVTDAGVAHRSVYGPFVWSAALGYSLHLAGVYLDSPMRIDGDAAVTTVVVESMSTPPGEW